MSYSERDGAVILTMSREDYQFICDCVRTLPTFVPRINQRAQEVVNRLNSGNPHYTPYQVEAKKS
jgi:hypothetical protein